MEAESLFAQTVRELDDAFYATFPDAAQTAQQLRLYTCYYHGPGDSNEVPTLEYAYQSSPIINNRPHHALHPAHSYHHFSARHARVRPDQPPQRGPPPLEKVHHQTHPSGPVGTQISDKPNKQQLLSLDSDKKPFLACLFCRTRKIVCGVPLPGYPDKTCGQCKRRSLKCTYPSESRRGKRKKKKVDTSEADTPPVGSPALDPVPSA